MGVSLSDTFQESSSRWQSGRNNSFEAISQKGLSTQNIADYDYLKYLFKLEKVTMLMSKDSLD